MGLCHEFGSQIRTGCDHPMRAGASACSCAECGVVCRGLFDGCPDVWARGPRPVAISATRAGAANGAPSATTTLPGPRPETARPEPGPARSEPSRATATGSGREGSAADAPVARRGAGFESDAGAIAYLEAAPVAIGPGIVGRPSAGGRTGTDRGMGDARRGTESGEAPRQDRAATAEPGRDTPGDPRREVFRWFEEAFEGVRLELQALIGSMTHQQAMLAELLDSRQAELRLALVAESLPDLVSDAVRAAMEEHTAAMAGSFDQSHERFRDDIDQIRADTADTVETLNQSFQKLSGAIAVHDEEAEQREAVRLGALKGSVTRQITPLTEALARLAAKFDALADHIDESDRSSASASAWAAPAPAAPKPAAAKPLAAARSAPKAAAPAIGKRVSTARMSRNAATADDPPVTPKRVATARVATVAAPAVAEPVRRGNGAASPVARRVATGRVATGRSTPPATPTARPAPTRTATSARTPTPARVATARVAAARASTTAATSDDVAEEAPVTAPIARVLTRRRAPDPAPALSDEPVVVYELEAEDEDDDDPDADWAPPAWVSAVARERAASPPSRTNRRPT
jgi:hypothetical protein